MQEIESIHLTPDITKKIIDQIVRVSHPKKIILFGSYAYGRPKDDSDIDFLIVKEKVFSKIEEYVMIRKSLKGFKFPFDIIIITPEEYGFYSKNWKNSVVAEAEEKGMVLYGE